MEVSPKNSSEQHFFKTQQTFKKINSSIEKDRNKDIIENVKYIPYHDLASNSATIGYTQKEIFDRKTKMILLEQESTRNHHKSDHTNCRVIELSDNDSKMVLRRRLGEMATERRNSNVQSDTTNYENTEILRKLPADTIVIKQEGRVSKENNNYRKLMEISNSLTSGYVTAEAKRICHKENRTIRNKIHETIEVRRNPVRVTKKNMDKNFLRAKRLLTDSKREACLDYEFSKRIKPSTMPYMNTRSVTRKMYTVGATYQAPTKRDEMEWKEWPVHGMHERPVYHSQAGLAAEYLGKYFTSFDGLSYCEIINEPEIEVVAIDPYRDWRISLSEKKSKGKIKMTSKSSSNVKFNAYLSMENKSFETCMHGSLHCVLGYCSQVMIPSYKQTVEERLMKLTVPAIKTSFLEKETNIKDNTTNSPENAVEFAEEANLLETYAIAMAQNVQNKSILNNTDGRKITLTSPSSSAIYIPEAQRSTKIDGSKTDLQSGEIIRINLKQILQNVPNSSLILLRSSAATPSDESCIVTTKNIFNPTKLEATSISDETLMKISSVNKKLRFTGKPALSQKKSPVRNNLYALKRHAINVREYATKKISLENQFETKKIIQITKETRENRNTDEIKISTESDGEISLTNSGKSRAWYTGKTSEIAKILSEYNRSMLKKSAINLNKIYDSKSIRVNCTNSIAKTLPKNLWQKDTATKKNQDLTNTNEDLDFSQEKWRKLHLTLDKAKNNQVIDNNQSTWNNSPTSSENHFLRDRAMKLNISHYIKEKPIEFRKNSNENEIVMIDARLKETKSKCSKNEMKISQTESLQELLENTAILYCAANGVHQDDLSNYIDTLDNKQSTQWLESWDNSIV